MMLFEKSSPPTPFRARSVMDCLTFAYINVNLKEQLQTELIDSLMYFPFLLEFKEYLPGTCQF